MANLGLRSGTLFNQRVLNPLARLNRRASEKELCGESRKAESFGVLRHKGLQLLSVRGSAWSDTACAAARRLRHEAAGTLTWIGGSS